MREAHITAATRGGYDTSMRNYAGRLLDMPVTEITRQAVSAHYRDLERRGLAVSTIRGAAAVIRGSLKHAHDSGWIPFNPVLGIVLPRAEAGSISEISDEDRTLVLKELGGHRLEARFRIGLIHMLRPAEALGLRWSSVDFDEGTLEVVGQLQWMKLHVDGKPLGTVYKASPKSKSGRRTLWLDDTTLALLKQWKLDQEKEAAEHEDTDWQIDRRASQAKRLAAAKRAGLLKMEKLYSSAPGDLVFTLRNTDPILPRKDADAWKAILEGIDAKHSRLYAMRHSAINRLYRHGAPLDAVSVAAGHTTPVFTWGRYGGDRSDMAKGLKDFI